MMKKTTVQRIIAVFALLAVWQIAAMILDQRAVLASPVQVMADFLLSGENPDLRHRSHLLLFG